jgi:hypothetical protein
MCGLTQESKAISSIHFYYLTVIDTTKIIQFRTLTTCVTST